MMELKDTTIELTKVIATMIITFGISSYSQYREERIVNNNSFTSPQDMTCYVNALTNLEPNYVRGYAIASKTCPSGNTFLYINDPNNLNRVRWISFNQILSNVRAVSASNVPDTTILAHKVDGNNIIIVTSNNDNTCMKQIINRYSGKIISTTNIQCPITTTEQN